MGSSTIWRRRLPVAVVFLLAMAAVLPSLRGGFFGGDDRDLILNFGPINHPSLAHAWKLLTLEPHRYLYQPVPMLGFAAEFALLQWLGLSPLPEAANSGAWVLHLTNVLIHAVNALLVWRLIRRLHGDWRVGFVAAVLFAVHPLAVEPTAWLNGRMTSLSVLFCLAALNAMDTWTLAGASGSARPVACAPGSDRTVAGASGLTGSGGWRRGVLPVLVVLFVVLAMASKVQVGLPVLMLMLPLARRRWPSRGWWVLWAVCGVATVGFAALNVWLTSRTHLLAAAAESLQGPRIARVSLALGWYFQRFVCPVGLAYVHPAPPIITWSSSGVLAGLLTVVVVGCAVLVSLRWTWVGVMGVVWFLAAVAATLPLIPSRNVAVAERYVYLSIVGLCWATAALSVHVWGRLRSRGARLATGGAAVACVFLLLVTSWRIASFYRDDVAGSLRVVQVYPDAPHAWESLAWAYHRAGRHTEAIDVARRDLENHPETACSAYQVIGMSEFELGRMREAIETLQAAVRSDPEDGKARYRLGKVYEHRGDVERALESYRIAVDRMPNHSPSYSALGGLLRRLGRSGEAVRCYEHILADNPYDAAAVLALSEIDIAAGRTGDAAARLERLVSWMPENWIAWTNLGVCYVGCGREAEAVDAYRRALAVNPLGATAALNLAGILLRRGDAAGAVFLVERLTAGTSDRATLWAAHDLLVAHGQSARAERMWSDAQKREPAAANLKAARAWACLLGQRWDAARELATAAAGSGSAAAESLAQMTLVMVSLAKGDPVPAVAWVNGASASTQPAHLDDRARMRQALMIYGEGHAEEPWPYYLMARLLRADGNVSAAEAAMRLFHERCRDDTCREQAGRLGVVGPMTAPAAAQSQAVGPR